MSILIDSKFCLYENGNFSLLDVCIGLTESEAKEILAFQGIKFRQENNVIIVDGINQSGISSFSVSYIVDSNKIISCLSFSYKLLTKDEAEKKYIDLCHNFESLNFNRQKETYTNDYANQSCFANSISKVDIMKGYNELMKMFAKQNSCYVRISIRSKLITPNTPYDVQKEILRLSVPIHKHFTNNDKKPSYILNMMHYINKTNILYTIILLLFTVIVSLFILWPNEKEEIDPLYSGELKNVDAVFVCTGPQSTTFHLYRNCYGLLNCSDEINMLTVDEAYEEERKLCRYCKRRLKEEIE